MAYSDPSLIDEYLLDRMSPSEKEKFIQMIEADEQLAQQVQERKESISAVEWMGDHLLKDRIKKLHESNLLLIRRRRRRVYAAAILLLLALAGGLLYYVYSGPDPSSEPAAIFAENFSAYPLNYGTRNIDATSEITQFSALYKEENYSEALQAINAIPDDSLASNILLAKANAQLASGQSRAAESIFRRILSQQDPIFSEYSRWYLALSLLQQDRLTEARQLLREIAEQPGHFQQEQATRMLKNLK